MRDLDREVLALVDESAPGFPLAVSSLQAGLYVTLRAFGAGPGAAVLCDPLFPFGALAALHAGARPVFPMIDGGLVPSERAWREAWTGDLVAGVATVAFGEHTAASRAVVPRGIPLLLDCAMAPFGAARRLDADAVGLSFARGKPVTCGEGGLLVFHDGAHRESALRWARFGEGNEPGGPVPPGLNCRLSPALVTVLRGSVERLRERSPDLPSSWAAAVDRHPVLGRLRPLPHEGSLGWFQAFEVPRDIEREALPRYVVGAGLQWKRCLLRETATARVPGTPDRLHTAAVAAARRLAWYRPDPDEPWDQR